MDIQKLTAAKLWIIGTQESSAGIDSARGLPYLTVALFALRPFPCSRVARITADTRWRLYVNADWLADVSVPETGRELAHLVWHLLSDHATRAHAHGITAASASVWRAAADSTIVDILRWTTLNPAHMRTSHELAIPWGRSTEENFAALSGTECSVPETGNGLDECGSAADGVPRDYELPPDIDAGDIGRHRAEAIRRQVAIDYRAHEGGRGDRYGRDARWAAEVLEPSVAWEPMLAAAVRRAMATTAGRGDFTYRRPSRRSASVPQVVLPGHHRPIPQVAIVLDTSGSVDDVLLGRALSELNQLLLSLNISESGAMVYSVDTAVHTAQRVRRAQDVKLVGAGGTDLRIGLAAAAQARPRPEIVIVFTDGDTPWPPEPPHNVSVIIVVLARGGRAHLPTTPDWATRIECRDEPRPT
jgi:predicted metal-dependent peptidase